MVRCRADGRKQETVSRSQRIFPQLSGIQHPMAAAYGRV